MNNYSLIGFVGTRGSGKDTAAGFLAPHFARVAFADKLKDIARDLYGLCYLQVHGTQEDKEVVDPRWGISPRHIMQQLGTEVARSIHPETWTRYLLDVQIPTRWVELERLRFAAHHPLRGFAITDVRFPSEADAVRSRGGYLVRITRPSCMVTDLYAQHASETEQARIDCHATVINAGSLEDFRADVLRAVGTLVSPA